MHAQALSHIHPQPFPGLTPVLSSSRLEKKDFREGCCLPWAQEVPSSNLGAPTNLLCYLRAFLKSPSPHYGENSGDPIGSFPASSPLLASAMRERSRSAHSWWMFGTNRKSFHEKADPCQEFFCSFPQFLPFTNFFPFSQAASVATLPSALLYERFSLGASWVFSIH